MNRIRKQRSGLTHQTSVETGCCGRGKGGVEALIIAPVTKRPRFKSDWTQMHSDVSTDRLLSEPFSHQPIISHNHNCKHTVPPQPTHPLSLTTAQYLQESSWPSSSSSWDPLPICNADYLSHLNHSYHIHSGTLISISSLPDNMLHFTETERSWI